MLCLLFSVAFSLVPAWPADRPAWAAEIADNAQSAAAPATQALSPQDHPKSFYEDRKRGWYWYEKQPEKPKQKKVLKKARHRRLPSLKDYTYEQLWNMYPDDFQALLNTFMKKAVQHPTEQNIMDYLIMQDIARRKAAAFTAAFGFVTQTHPELTTSDVYPITTPGRASRTRTILNEVDATIRASANDFALIMFVKPGCQFCEAQAAILKYFTENYDWPIRTIDIEQNPNTAARFNVTLVPTILVVGKDSGQYLPISVGVISLADLKTRLYRSIRYLRGEIKPQQWFMYDFEKGKSTDPLGRITWRRREVK